MDSPLHFETRGPIGLLTLNRPERLNSIDFAMLKGLRAFFDERQRDFATRVIVVTGTGRGFCAGLDLKASGNEGAWQPGAGPVQNLMAFQEDIAELTMKMRSCPQPIIAAVNGPATGGGLSIAIASDMRIAKVVRDPASESPGKKMGTSFAFASTRPPSFTALGAAGCGAG